MQAQEILSNLEVFKTAEEKQVLETLCTPQPLAMYDEREKFVINNLMKKSLVSKVKHNGLIMVVKI